jgi:hypothetical protein
MFGASSVARPPLPPLPVLSWYSLAPGVRDARAVVAHLREPDLRQGVLFVVRSCHATRASPRTLLVTSGNSRAGPEASVERR